MAQKVVEFYLETLKEYTTKLNKSKITVLMQVGEFFEIYGLIYPDGTRVGNVWEFCDDVNLKVAAKPQVVYDNSNIQVFMGGVGESYINPYLQKAVDKFGWTIVLFEQQRIGNSSKFERKEASIISPGVNINSDSFANISMVIYIEQTRKYYEPSKTNTTLANHSNTDKYQIQIGVAYVDCLTGENGVMAINNSNSKDISIPLDELLKLLTIKNPNELNLYLENIPIEKISDDDLINSLHLFNYNYKIHRNITTISTSENQNKYHKLAYQNALFELVFIQHRGIMDITQQIGLDGAEYTYSRLALVLLIEFILKHDKTVIDKLKTPEILINSDKYLMLANNALEQLDVLDNMKQEYKKCSNRTTLLDLLDNTKTPLGKTLFRQRLSIPITDVSILETRYQQISDFITLQTAYMSNTAGARDKYGSPLFQLRQHLGSVRNIENYLRKAITGKLQPFEIGIYIESLIACKNVYNYIYKLISESKNAIIRLYPAIEHIKIFAEVIDKFHKAINTETLRANVWSGVEANPFKKGISSDLDQLQTEIDNDREFLDNLIKALSRVIEPQWVAEKDKQLIFTGENASKGIHIFTNTSRKEQLEAFFSRKDAVLKVGTYNIKSKDICFLKMKESKWEIEIPYLKTSNGTLKANIDRMGKLAKQEFNKWLGIHITTVIPILDALSSVARFIAEIDVLQSNVLNAIEKGYSRPVIDNETSLSSYLDAKLIRHPIIEHIMTTNKYVPNDISLGSQDTNSYKSTTTSASIIDGVLLFGVNAVGKSSLMKSLGLNIIMAQAGMYVSASSLRYRPFKYLFTRILGNDNLYAGLSSFEVEMKEFKVILKYADADSLLLCDEVCKGTVTEDGTALVAAALEILSRRKVKFLSATHLHNLTNMDCVKKLNNVGFYHLLVEQDPNDRSKLIYTRKLQQGSGPSSYGILVANSMNMDFDFIKRAQEIRQNISNSSSTLIMGSKYNKDKILGMCEVCNKMEAVDVHHINQQCDADSNNLVNTLDGGIFNKNKLWNLVALCKLCHQGVHSSPPKIHITGYSSTSTGLKLIFNINIIEKDLHFKDEFNSISNVFNDYSMIKEVDKVEEVDKVDKVDKSKTQNPSKLLTSEIKGIIQQMKANGLSPKKIQFDLKRFHNQEITQKEIRIL